MCVRLEQLRLHSNKLTSLPDSMAGLSMLELLTLRDNQVLVVLCFLVRPAALSLFAGSIAL